MIAQQQILSKLNHTRNKLQSKLGVSVEFYGIRDIDNPMYEGLDDTDIPIYLVSVSIEGTYNPYIKYEVKRLRKWFDKYNKKHNTNYNISDVSISKTTNGISKDYNSRWLQEFNEFGYNLMPEWK